MTFKELMELKYLDKIHGAFPNWGCPSAFFNDPVSSDLECPEYPPDDVDDCVKCWNREVPKSLLEELGIQGDTEKNIKIPDEETSSLKWDYDDAKPIGKVVSVEETEGWINITMRGISDEKLKEELKRGLDPEPRILDSGNRRQFETGAVRDICEGKGRCDLLPLDVVSHALNNPTFAFIHCFVDSGDHLHLYKAFSSCGIFHDYYTLMLEVAKHFEEGCKKYGDNNWQKGIPTHCYVDSAVRHYLKYLRGDKDEPHGRAFCWNILCCIWTCIHKPELNDYKNPVEE